MMFDIEYYTCGLCIISIIDINNSELLYTLDLHRVTLQELYIQVQQCILRPTQFGNIFMTLWYISKCDM